MGYYKKTSGNAGMVYAEALEQALCFGWIDGRVQSLDEHSYQQRFTPRRLRSYWSAVNIRKAQALLDAGLMHPAGLKAFEARGTAPPGRYSNENRGAAFDAAMIKQFKANRPAWRWFEQQAPSFRRVAAHWVTSAKRPETRASRLATLIECAGRGENREGSSSAARRPSRISHKEHQGHEDRNATIAAIAAPLRWAAAFGRSAGPPGSEPMTVPVFAASAAFAAFAAFQPSS